MRQTGARHLSEIAHRQRACLILRICRRPSSSSWPFMLDFPLTLPIRTAQCLPAPSLSMLHLSRRD